MAAADVGNAGERQRRFSKPGDFDALASVLGDTMGAMNSQMKEDLEDARAEVEATQEALMQVADDLAEMTKRAEDAESEVMNANERNRKIEAEKRALHEEAQHTEIKRREEIQALREKFSVAKNIALERGSMASEDRCGQLLRHTESADRKLWNLEVEMDRAGMTAEDTAARFEALGKRHEDWQALHETHTQSADQHASAMTAMERKLREMSRRHERCQAFHEDVCAQLLQQIETKRRECDEVKDALRLEKSANRAAASAHERLIQETSSARKQLTRKHSLEMTAMRQQLADEKKNVENHLASTVKKHEEQEKSMKALIRKHAEDLSAAKKSHDIAEAARLAMSKNNVHAQKLLDERASLHSEQLTILRTKVEDSERTIIEMGKDMKRAKSQHVKEMEQKQSEIYKLEAALKEQHDAFKEKEQELTSRIHTLEVSSAKKQNQLDSLLSDLKQKSNRASALERELSTLSAENSRLSADSAAFAAITVDTDRAHLRRAFKQIFSE